MPETRTSITVNGAPLGAHDLDLVQSLSLEETLGGQDKVSITVRLVTSDRSAWTSSIDPLVAAATPFHVALNRGRDTVEVEARSVSAGWQIAPGGISTITVEGMDRSVDLDRRDVQRLWQDTDDAAIAQTLFAEHGLAAEVDDTPSGADSDTYSPQQSDTDWAFLKKLAGRNGFDLHIESIGGVVTGVFKKVDVNARPQTTLTLGYGALGGNATASVQLLAGQEVHVTRTVPGSADVDAASDTGRGHPMGTRSLGGVTLVRTHTAGQVSVLDAQSTATAMAERSAFGATLTATLTSADSPLIRARRTVTVAGLGEALDGPWLVRSVRHTITPGGHSQAIGLIRNALGDPGVGGGMGGPAGAVGAAVGITL